MLVTITSNTTVELFRVTDTEDVSIDVGGTFGSGTLAFTYSVDGGTTTHSLLDNGTAISLTAADNFVLTTGDKIVYATMSGATAPSVQICCTGKNLY